MTCRQQIDHEVEVLDRMSSKEAVQSVPYKVSYIGDGCFLEPILVYVTFVVAHDLSLENQSRE